MEKEIIHITDDLRKAVADIKNAILGSQYRLARSGNGESEKGDGSNVYAVIIHLRSAKAERT